MHVMLPNHAGRPVAPRFSEGWGWTRERARVPWLPLMTPHRCPMGHLCRSSLRGCTIHHRHRQRWRRLRLRQGQWVHRVYVYVYVTCLYIVFACLCSFENPNRIDRLSLFVAED